LRTSKIHKAIDLRNQGLKFKEISELVDVPKHLLTKEMNRVQIIKGFQYEIFPTKEQAEYIPQHDVKGSALAICKKPPQGLTQENSLLIQL